MKKKSKKLVVLDHHTNKKKLISHIWCVGYQNRVKRMCGDGFKMVEKGQILMPFSGLAPSKLLIPFSIWVMGGRTTPPPPCVMGRENRPCPKGLRYAVYELSKN